MHYSLLASNVYVRLVSELLLQLPMVIAMHDTTGVSDELSKLVYKGRIRALRSLSIVLDA
jgi:hypothetical protein